MNLCDKYGHMQVIVYTNRIRDWLRKRYWLRCWDCDEQQGPFKTDAEARQAMREQHESRS